MFSKPYPVVFSILLLISYSVIAEEASVSAVEDAVAAKAEAETAKAEAEAAKVEAESAKAEAETAKSEAETAKTEAEAAKTEAIEVKEAVQSQAIIEQTMAIDVDAETPDSERPPEEKAKEKPKAWAPSAIDFDWIQLTSNEWLKGEIKGMYKDNLEFDSDKLDLLDIDWLDVKVLRGYKISNVNIEDVGATKGKLEITGDVVQVINADGTDEYDRLKLISFAPGGEREADLWSAKVTLGLDFKKGNTDQLDFTGRATVKRRASRTRFVLDYIGNISKTDGGVRDFVETVNNHRVNANFDYYKTRYFFYNPVFAEFFKDPFSNIKVRVQIGTGIGYTVIDDGATELSFSGGPAFVKTSFVSVLPGELKSESTVALVLRTNYDTALTGTIDFIGKYNIQYGNQESGGYTHHVIATIESELTKKLDIDISLIWDRIDNPTRDADGNSPATDDYRMTVGLSYTY